MDFSKLPPADKQKVSVYTPYYSSKNDKLVLPFALTLYDQGAIEGERQIAGGQSIPFVATWFKSVLPADLTRCTVKFENKDDYTYDVMLSNHEFVSFLIRLMVDSRRTKVTDFPQEFYRKLLQYED